MDGLFSRRVFGPGAEARRHAAEVQRPLSSDADGGALHPLGEDGDGPTGGFRPNAAATLRQSTSWNCVPFWIRMSFFDHKPQVFTRSFYVSKPCVLEVQHYRPVPLQPGGSQLAAVKHLQPLHSANPEVQPAAIAHARWWCARRLPRSWTAMSVVPRSKVDASGSRKRSSVTTFDARPLSL